jgi:hypothetical protein
MTTKEKRRRIEELTEEITSLRFDIAVESKECQHVWEPPLYDPLPATTVSFIPGSCSLPGYFQNNKRWSRTCELCGDKQYTYKEKVVSVAPDFGDQ